MRPKGAAVLALLAAAGCGQAAEGASVAVPPTAAPPAAASPSPSRPSVPSPTASPLLGRPGGWRITTYYTAVQSFYKGRAEAVRGCPRPRCSNGRDPLGSYPEDFLKVVRMEGSGRLTSGPNRGRYLNWATGVGFWLDETTRDSRGLPLRPWESAAVDRSVLARGQRFLITGCGRDGNGRPTPAGACARFRQARWTVTDVFRPGHGGEGRADLYIGEETGPGFAGSSPFYTTLRGATLAPA
ncbi:hypothetical protein [Spirillospora albida]|uniref:hypothetical protein n=1 Tax=Spirillospora albida TaxID=58123 RepID=UPI0004C19EB3|nr:hypothetical protein [Spirillospora albida]